MRVLFIASEVAPFAKTGGLADVTTGSLPLALGELGVEVVIMVPRYRGLTAAKKKISPKVTVYFVENEVYFNRTSLYGNEWGDYTDNLQRFAYFSHRALSLAKEIGFKPDIVHAHDWQTALVPVILKTKLNADPFFQNTKTLLTIHNLAYQGKFPYALYGELGLDPALFTIDGFEFYGDINILKAGILFADEVSTVSPNYAKEIQTKEYGFGLEGVIKKRAKNLRGILNGIDTEDWDPETDKVIKRRFSANKPEGKLACKLDLQSRCKLKADEDVPVFAVVTRLAQQKGLDVLAEIIESFLAKNVQFVLLGNGDAYYEDLFKKIGQKYAKNMAVFLGFDAAEAHRIYAGADFFLMPSWFEPCGLGQLISLRYGAIPIVRRTGGLADTIVDIDANPKRGNGFRFGNHNAQNFLKAIDRSLALFRNKKRFLAAQKRVMKLDFSWEKSAKEYKGLYSEMLES